MIFALFSIYIFSTVCVGVCFADFCADVYICVHVVFYFCTSTYVLFIRSVSFKLFTGPRGWFLFFAFAYLVTSPEGRCKYKYFRSGGVSTTHELRQIGRQIEFLNFFFWTFSWSMLPISRRAVFLCRRVTNHTTVVRSVFSYLKFGIFSIGSADLCPEPHRMCQGFELTCIVQSWLLSD